MALFRPYERTKSSGDRIAGLTPKEERAKRKTRPAEETAEPATVTEPPTKVKVPRKKSGPTPSRREAEAARMERLHPTLTPREQRKADARARAEARANAWDKVERSPERTLLRDFVDTRWTVAEFLMPAMILIMAAMMVFMRSNDATISVAIGSLMWGLLALSVIQLVIMWRGYKRLLDERHPDTPKRGLFMYMFNRALMIRRFRQPSPRIGRGEAI